MVPRLEPHVLQKSGRLRLPLSPFVDERETTARTSIDTDSLNWSSSPKPSMHQVDHRRRLAAGLGKVAGGGRPTSG